MPLPKQILLVSTALAFERSGASAAYLHDAICLDPADDKIYGKRSHCGDLKKVSSDTARKKWQNRLRQRAWRQRRAANRELIPTDSINNPTWKGYGLLMVTVQASKATTNISATVSTPMSPPQEAVLGRESFTDAEECSDISKRDKLIPPLLPYNAHGVTTNPLPLRSFPISADHCLITLVQYNVVRAVLFNLSILSKMDHVPLGCGRLLRIPRFNAVPPPMIPPDLQPSLLQKSTPHQFWIDALPFPRLRDNLILLSKEYDSSELFYDLGQGLYEGFEDTERRGYLVWGDPWSASAWEATEGFVQKWGFLLAGCADAVDSTNRWREIRGEDKLMVAI